MSMVERITGPDDPRIAPYRSVADAELVRSLGLFVAEGRLVVRRVLGDGRYRIRSILVNESALKELRPLIEGLPAAPAILQCDTRDFLPITGFDFHRGCLALVERPAPVAVNDLIADARRIVVLDGVTNADNVGGVFRNAAAFGADAVVLSPTSCDPFYRKAIRTSMGAVLGVPFARAEAWPADIGLFRAAGLTVAALTPRPPSETLDTFAGRTDASRVALIVGAEGAGLTPSVEATADVRVRIPIREGVDSLNLAVAVGIALYRLATPL
jgi:tRNA G18 (ribose-2'-O)-methylase SpoU